jgi:hypothetical protein
VGPWRLDAFLVAFAVLVIPNLLLSAAIFLSAAALTRKMLANYVGGIVLLFGWATGRVMLRSVDAGVAETLIDPFGGAALDYATRYWTITEQNLSPIPLAGPVLVSRALWLAIGLGIMALCAAAFRFAHAPERRSSIPWDPAAAGEAPPSLVVPPARRSFTLGARLQQLAAETRRGVREVVANVWFPILVGILFVFVATQGSQVGAIYGTETFPVTYKVLEMLEGPFILFLVIIIAFYAGELVWHERELRASGIHDSLPVPAWVPLVARFAALVGIVVALLFAGMVCGILIQLSKGYFGIEIGLYVRELFAHELFGSYVPLIALAVLIQTLVNHKYVGHFVFILWFVGQVVLFLLLGVEHNLLAYGSAPSLTYSDMNGYGHPIIGFRWLTLYWLGVSLLLAVLSNLFWVRGEETGARWRLRLARLRLTRPLLAATAGLVVLVLATGGFIFYNTNVLNDFENSEEGEAIQARYERDYKRYEWAPQPRISAVRLQVDIFPRRRDLRMRGTYRLANRTGETIDSLHVDVLNSLRIRELKVDRPAERVVSDSAAGYYVFRLARPMAPGDSAVLSFDLEHDSRGFENEPSYRPVVWNGTFFDAEWLPSIGYNAGGELVDEGERRRRGLGTRNLLAYDADWMDFQVTVGTDLDQTAVAPGYLRRTWTEGGRRYFDYAMDAPMLNFYAFLSGRYKVAKDRWNGVAIEVHHHPGHEENVPRMIRSVKASLDYYTRQFGPYQHRQVRILEFPRYGEFAQSFDNTIPYSEAIGFIADVRKDDIDYPFFVTAHEVAHQWWGHQIAPADVQGAATLSETLAEYGALMVMEKEHGREEIGRFLQFELDQYLRGRGGERRAEQPLVLVENQQYIHYNKGALAMYALRDWIGEERVNAALRAFLAEWKFRGPPYPTARDLVKHLRAATPDSLQHVVGDLFEHVTLYENRAVRATSRAAGAGRWEVALEVEARKIRADSLGIETDVPVGDWIDVGVYTAGRAEPVYLRKHRVTQARQTIRVVVDQPPARAGIDPLHKLIDRKTDDNVVRVTPGAPRERARPKADGDTANRDTTGG